MANRYVLSCALKAQTTYTNTKYINNMFDVIRIQMRREQSAEN